MELQDEMLNAAIQKPPLLRLPAELRNRIYVEALGGNTIHVFRSIRRYNCDWFPSSDHYIVLGPLRSAICCAPGTDEAAVHEYHDDTQTALNQPGPNRHLACEAARDKSYSCALLRTCRQIAEETSLVPYAENIFSFGNLWIVEGSEAHEHPGDAEYDPRVFERFIVSLNSQQKAAIREIILTSATKHLHLHADPTSPSQVRQIFPLSKNNARALSSLVKVTVILDIYKLDGTELMMGRKSTILDGLGNLAMSPLLQSMQLSVYEHGRLPIQSWRDWATAFTKRIMWAHVVFQSDAAGQQALEDAEIETVIREEDTWSSWDIELCYDE